MTNSPDSELIERLRADATQWDMTQHTVAGPATAKLEREAIEALSASAERERLLRGLLSEAVVALMVDDDEGLFEHSGFAIRARAALRDTPSPKKEGTT